MATADRILQLKLVSDVSIAQKGMKTRTRGHVEGAEGTVEGLVGI